MLFISRLLRLCFFLLTPRKLRWIFNRWGWNVHATAKIGLSLILVDNLKIGKDGRIGHLNVIKALKTLSLGDNSSIGHLNWISAFTGDIFSSTPLANENRLTMDLAKGAAITHRHMFDCTGGLKVGEFSLVAGWGSRFIGHGIDIYESRQQATHITIGDYCMIGSSVIFVGPVDIKGHCIIAPGAVLKGMFLKPFRLIGGVPAKEIKVLEADAVKYFSRKNPHIS